MSPYIYDQPEWPRFCWDSNRLMQPLASVRHQQGRLLGRMDALGFRLQQEAVLQTLAEDVVKSSEIEGEKLDVSQVRSSFARRLGMDGGRFEAADRHIEGAVEMMLDATRHFDRPLTPERLFAWHASLFPTGHSGKRRISVGAWRDDSAGLMQIVSGPVGQERVHFEAPAAGRLEQETQLFLEWFNQDGASADAVLKAGIAHLWFVTINPFDDGNGRIARTIADLVLARSERSPQRFYSMSGQIRKERTAYYDILEQTQKGTLEITPWLEWFLACFGRAIDGAQALLTAVLSKARFWQAFSAITLTERQRLVLNRVLDGSEGKLTTSKWAAIANCSSDTALRDIRELVEGGILIRNPGGGRSVSYSLADFTKSRDAVRPGIEQ
jgi:Fic family protein